MAAVRGPASVAEPVWTSRAEAKKRNSGSQEKEKNRNEEPNAGKIPERNDSSADETFRVKERDGRAESFENHGQHRLGRSQPERQAAGHRGAGTWPDHRPEADHHPG